MNCTHKAIISDHICQLGESPLWLPQRKSFLWLDIISKNLFEKQYSSQKKTYDTIWSFAYTPTALFHDRKESNIIWIIGDNGIHRFNLNDGSDYKVHDITLPLTHRSNDGSIAPDGTMYFGTMQREPNGKHGTLYSFDLKGNLQKLPFYIGIPNTFAWIDLSHVAISDSLTQRIDLYQAQNGTLCHVDRLYDFSSYGGEPDGGAVDRRGMLWVALWGKGQIVCIDPQKKAIIDTLEVSVPYPSSCCFGGPEQQHLFVTSATVKEDSQGSQRGKCFLFEMNIAGKSTTGFSLCL